MCAEYSNNITLAGGNFTFNLTKDGFFAWYTAFTPTLSLWHCGARLLTKVN